MTVINMLNTKYFKFGDAANAVMQNPSVLGDAWFVENVKYVNSPDEEIAALNGLNAAKVAVMDKSRFEANKGNYSAPQGSLKLTTYEPMKMVYQSDNQQEGLAVFSEIYYPEGWTATVDGQPAKIMRANYALRALDIPAGKHEIVFSFEPSSYHTGNTIASISSIIMVFTLLAGIGWFFYQKKKENEQKPSVDAAK